MRSVQQDKPWAPVARLAEVPPHLRRTDVGHGEIAEVWANPDYEVFVYYLEPRGRGGWLWLSIKQMTREAVHDWRHLQSIKNEVCGWEREALELFPAESRLTDGANQTHLWVMPANDRFPLGFTEGRNVATEAQMREALKDTPYAAVRHKGRQRPFQPGLSTGPDYRPKGANW